MKNVFLFIGIIISTIVFGQKLNSVQEMPKDNYLMSCSPNDSITGNFIFQQSKKVYFNYNRQTKVAENPYTQGAKMIRDLFDCASKINWATIKTLDEKTVTNSVDHKYDVIEYRINGKVYRVCWDEYAKDGASVKLSTLLDMMNGFW